MEDNKFNFFVPINDELLEKASKLPKSDRYKNMFLEGMASDNSQDIEGEVLEPNGYEIDHFLKNGLINYEHLSKRSPKYWIGSPVKAEIKNNEFHIKAQLWENSEIARDTWDKIIEMKESGSDRKVGWSIEGKALNRSTTNPKHITRALITNCAITFSPVNGNSYADIAKGLQKEDYIDPTYDQDSDEKEYIMEFENKGKKYRVGKDYKVFEVLTKSMDVAAVKPLTPESLDKKPKNISLPDIKKALDNILKHKSLFDGDSDFKNKVIKLVKNSL